MKHGPADVALPRCWPETSVMSSDRGAACRRWIAHLATAGDHAVWNHGAIEHRQCESYARSRCHKYTLALTYNKPVAKKRKNPYAVALGRKGGRKGGPARAANMTTEERSES